MSRRRQQRKAKRFKTAKVIDGDRFAGASDALARNKAMIERTVRGTPGGRWASR